MEASSTRRSASAWLIFAATLASASSRATSSRDVRSERVSSVTSRIFARGSVTINDPVDGDGTGPIVTGDEWSKDRDATTTTWGGTKVRFRIIGGSFRIVVRGRGINLSLVGRGNVTLIGAGTADDGTYSVNGSDYFPLPAFPYLFALSATTIP